ncbi:MAG: squalene/phytoene synthase family protein [Chloroflexi bacterium]|nr:squalene/phytoene synthase family protein [Chloroflexota bacterium]
MTDALKAIDRDRIQEFLVATSRTFALCIPMMPGMLRDALGLGYLLLRNADTIEDAYRWPKSTRIELLEVYKQLLMDPNPEGAREFAARFDGRFEIDDQDHLALLESTPYLLDQASLLPTPYLQAITEHVVRVIEWMQIWVEMHDDGNRLQLLRLKQLDDYCYAVAGIVAELLTSLISLYRPTVNGTRLLMLRSLETAFGAGLQLTNIIKDIFRDHQEGRHYIPQDYLPFKSGGSREGLMPIVAHAYRNLCLGREYLHAVPEEEFDIRKAVLVPLFLGVATLRHLTDNLDVLLEGADVKISREKVVEILTLADEVAGKNLEVRRVWVELSGSLLDLDGVNRIRA